MMSELGASKVCEVIHLWLVKGPELEKMYLCCWKRLLFDRKNLRLFFSSREFFFSSIWTAKTSLRSVLTTVRSRKRKILSRKRNFAFEFFHLRATSFQPLGTIILQILSISSNFAPHSHFLDMSKNFLIAFKNFGRSRWTGHKFSNF